MARERNPKQIEAFQRGRRNELDKVVGKTVAAVHDIGQEKAELVFDDGTKLEVSGETDKSPYAIYYKVRDDLTDEEKEEINRYKYGYVDKAYED